jgi:hypothetical protein
MSLRSQLLCSLVNPESISALVAGSSARKAIQTLEGPVHVNINPEYGKNQ